MFAGQGSQYAGMGKDLYESFPESKAVFDKADEVLGFSLTRLCFQGPLEELTKTDNCQPAIVTMTVAAFEAFRTTEASKELSCGFAAGLSLGEYSALVAASALTFEDAVYLVRRRGEFMEEEARKYPGKMASVLGLDLAALKDICDKTGAQIANINSPGQIVISGGAAQVKEASAAAEQQGARRVIELEVSGAFHSSLMKGASVRLAGELAKIKIGEPRIPVISNVTGRPVTVPSEIRDNLIKQVASSVLWEDSMRFMLSAAVNSFIEFGPGKVLKGLMRRIDEKACVSNMEKKEDIVRGGLDACKR